MRKKVTRGDFENILKKGKNTHSPLLSLKYYFVDDGFLPSSKFSFVISSKISKKATERNLFKRRGRHILRKLKDRLKNGFVGAFFAKKGANSVVFDSLEGEIVSLFKKSDILK